MAQWRSGRPQGPLSFPGLVIAIAVIAIDQIAKVVAVGRLPIGQPIDLLPILTLYRVENTGIAFSFFAGSGVALIALTIAVSVVIIAFWAWARDGGRVATIGFALILGGAIGNLIDRLRLGAVVDFLLLHVGGRTLFVFNLADAALTLGPILLLAVYMFPPRGDGAS